MDPKKTKNTFNTNWTIESFGGIRNQFTLVRLSLDKY